MKDDIGKVERWNANWILFSLAKIRNKKEEKFREEWKV